MFRNPFAWVALLAVVVIAGPRMCAKQAAEAPAEAPEAVTQETRQSPPTAPWWADGAGAILSVAPERLRLEGASVAPQTLDVSYRIREPETVLEAWLELQVSVVGELARVAVPIQASGSVRFDVMPRRHSLGPHVRFRAACPQGTTDWHSLGSPPRPLAESEADVFQIGYVSPSSIPWSTSLDPAYGGGGGGKRVSISGKRLTADCRIEAQVNGSSVELHGVRHTGRRFEGLLYYEDINYDAIAPRYADLQLVVKRKGSLKAAGKTMPFD